jgi:hypothetical protein
MKINSISVANVQKPVFNGLWGKEKFSYTESLYGGEYDCDYFEKSYHPCLDETAEEIKEKMSEKEKELNSDIDVNSVSGSYITPVLGKRLPFTKRELNAILQDCKTLLTKEVPQGPLNDFVEP